MTGAELKTLRESLGLPVAWLAEQANVQQRTVNYWEAGEFAVPDDVADLVLGIEKRFSDAVCEASGAAPGHDGQSPVLLLRYRTNDDLWLFEPDFKPLPVTSHAALLYRLQQAFKHKAVPVKIQWMDRDDYQTWLNGRKDTPDLKTAWAESRT